jgi:1-acyl-sn-glycerol-3-phosphate acyltransferase
MGLKASARRAARASGFVSITAALASAHVASAQTVPASERLALRDRWLRRWAGALLALFAIRTDVHRDPGRATRGRLVVANHRSTIDVALLLGTFGGRMVARHDLATWPVVGPAARSVGTVFVDRTSATSGAGAIREIRDLLLAGHTVCVFPEGTTFADDEVREFHPGAFVAALKSNAEIVPVGIAYARGSGAAFVNEPFLAHLSRMAAADPTRVAMCVGAPFAVESNAKAAALRDRARRAVQELVDEARAHVDHEA